MITVYSNGCPRCKVLKMKLEQKGIAYTECQDIDAMEKLGITSVPMMDVDGAMMTFEEAVKFVNEG